MKALIAIVALVFASSGVLAAEEKKEPSGAQKAQQEKMTFCNAEAKTKALTGDERKQFMSNCLKKAPAAATPATSPEAVVAPAKTSQQDKMTECNAKAGSKALKGDERKAFMSECLKG